MNEIFFKTYGKVQAVGKKKQLKLLNCMAMENKSKEKSQITEATKRTEQSQSQAQIRPAGKNRPEDQAGGIEHSGGDAKEDRNP